MKKITLLLALLLFATGLVAQTYNTPNTGVHWNLHQLAQHHQDIITETDSAFILQRDLLIAPQDTLSIVPGSTLYVNDSVLISVEGCFLSVAQANTTTLITATDSLQPYDGFRFEDSASVRLKYTKITYGGGLKVITPNFILTHSTIAHHTNIAATGAAVALSNGAPVIAHNRFIKNDLPAISSSANGKVAAIITDNYLKANGQFNQNRPQINMGTSGADTLKIIGNTIIGNRQNDNVGGIAVANLVGGALNAIIANNTITDNRYGMTVIGGNVYVEITANTIEDNDTQGLPALGGSGIALNATNDTQTIIATGNEIRRNLWGITLQNEASINLGDSDMPGNNVFADNGNGGTTYALYNNTDNTILAKSNCWIEGEETTAEDVATVIFDQADDASLGEVIYTPVHCQALQNQQLKKQPLTLYPNPTKGVLKFSGSTDFTQVLIFSLAGKYIDTKQLKPAQKEIHIDLAPGLYLLLFKNEEKHVSKKLRVL